MSFLLLVKEFDEIFCKKANQFSDPFSIFIKGSPKANATALKFFVSAFKVSKDFFTTQIICVIEEVRGGKGESFGEAGVSFGFHGG